MEIDDPSLAARKQAPRPTALGLQRLLAIALLAFVLGAAVVTAALHEDWFGVRALAFAEDGRSDAARAEPLASEPLVPLSDAPPLPRPTNASQAAEVVERVAEQQGGLDQRIAAAEQRIARLDLAAQAAAGNASRAEALLVAFATRRVLERGTELGYLEDQLRLRFGAAQPNAVRAVLAAAADPVTEAQLLGRLSVLADELTQNGGQPLDRLTRELSDLFVVRRADTPSPRPQVQLERARRLLDNGRIEEAARLVARLPGAASAEGWLRDARRLARAREALDVLETTAILEPNRLRDAGGDTIEQPSPAG